ncbi:zinc finger protein 569-like [Maniola jurtina]|uniref:zinc finger protein 569-like n=1 Tax=Maniola jurtina TaxID=191418 RepID=UPI001E68DFB9|nr:zinc finger protein 569-like [Maniola jurtina]XP_045779686.1 zinc finger protein 569-like [Maniola jurtina]
MRCCVPFCNNTSDNVITSDGKGISFHGFPREGGLRVAWLSALGMQGSQLPDSAMICSRHFLDDDICETEGGFRQLVAGAIPSAVQVCMICLDSDSKLFLMRKHKLEEAYDQLTGHPVLCDAGNLKQTLCVQCAQRLRNFSKFRDKSLRARALMMDLVDKHELITTQHIQMIDRTQHQLKSNIGWTVLGTNPCDLYILEHPSEDKQTELGETIHSIIVKNEPRDDSMSVDGDTEVTNEDDNKVCSGFVASNEGCLSDANMSLQAQLLDEALYKALNEKAPVTQQEAETQDLIKHESVPLQCILCTEEFLHAHVYMQHMHLHLQSGVDEEACAASQVCKPQAAEFSDPSLTAFATDDKLSIWKQINEPRPSADLPLTVGAPLSARLATKNETIEESERGSETNNGEVAVSSNKAHINIDTLTNCVVKLYDCKKFKVVPRQDGSLMKTRKTVSSYENPNIDNVPTIFKEFLATGHNVAATTDDIKPVINEIKVEKDNSNTFPEKKSFICDVCRKMFKRKYILVKHIQTHNKVKNKCNLTSNMQHNTALKPYACDVCNFSTAHSGNLRNHLRIHTGEKPFTCTLCSYRSATNSHIVRHMTTHTGEKRFSCTACNYKCVRNCSLVSHMRNHRKGTPYACTLCEYECKQNSSLVAHMKTHRVGKPYSCSLCEYKCSTNSGLVNHMTIHGEKPYSCSLCKYKCSTDARLVVHMRTHTGEKPYLCNFCDYKCSASNRLAEHMRIHTGEKPYSCNLCAYRCSTNTRLVVHMRTHTGEKPYSCDLCPYKFVDRGGLVRHMRSHTGEKPHACTFCSYKCSRKTDLVNHMRSHTGEKPYSCSLCEYKCSQNNYLVNHMKAHTGENMTHACTVCDYKCSRSSYLVSHMKYHTAE